MLSGLLLLAVLIVSVSGRVVYEGERQLSLSTQALEAKDVESAVFHARAAALWYAPGAPHVRVAYERLWALGQQAEERKLWDVSLLAYRSIVSASASTRWIVAPQAERARAAELAIERIESERLRPRGAPEQPAPSLTVELPARDTLVFRLLLLGGVAALIAGLGWWVLRGFDETGRTHLRRALPGVIVAGLGLAAYVAALFLA